MLCITCYIVPLKLFTKINPAADPDKPIYVTMQYGGQFISWNLPYEDNSNHYNELLRTICILNQNQIIDIRVEVKTPECIVQCT